MLMIKNYLLRALSASAASSLLDRYNQQKVFFLRRLRVLPWRFYSGGLDRPLPGQNFSIVGSLLRSPELLQAGEAYNEGRIEFKQLREIEGRAVL
jgi:hypothetical protein